MSGRVLRGPCAPPSWGLGECFRGNNYTGHFEFQVQKPKLSWIKQKRDFIGSRYYKVQVVLASVMAGSRAPSFIYSTKDSGPAPIGSAGSRACPCTNHRDWRGSECFDWPGFGEWRVRVSGSHRNHLAPST